MDERQIINQLLDDGEELIDEAQRVLLRVKKMTDPVDEVMAESIIRHFRALYGFVWDLREIFALVERRRLVGDRLITAIARSLSYIDMETALLSSLVDLNDLVCA